MKEAKDVKHLNCGLLIANTANRNAFRAVEGNGFNSILGSDAFLLVTDEVPLTRAIQQIKQAAGVSDPVWVIPFPDGVQV